MNVKTKRKTEPRIDTEMISNLGIRSYGHNNIYPQEIIELVAASESASSCMDKYISFVQGNGFKDIQFSEKKINRYDETPDDILEQLAFDVANFGGLSIHVNYNVFGQIIEINHVPFENCRITEPDETGNVGKIAVHPDWTGRTKRAGKILKVSKENIDYIDRFNPDSRVVFMQMEEAGGIEHYKGQILWVSFKGKQTYPVPKHDSVVSYMSTEEGLGNISNRNVRNNFFPFGYLITKKGENTSEKENQNEDESIQNSLKKLQGDTNTGKVLQLEIEFDEEAPKFEKIDGANYDKDFTVTTSTAAQKIYAAFNQEIVYRITTGSIGFSSQIMTEFYEYYSTVTSKERRMIERAFNKIFKHWHEPETNDFTVQPLVFVSSTKDYNEILSLYEKNIITLNQLLSKSGLEEREDGDTYLSDKQTTPLAIRLGVGGTQALQGILSDIETSKNSKVNILEILFDINREDAIKMIYGTPDNIG